MTSDGVLLAYSDIDDALGLFDSESALFSDIRQDVISNMSCLSFYTNPFISVNMIGRLKLYYNIFSHFNRELSYESICNKLIHSYHYVRDFYRNLLWPGLGG